MITNSFTIKVSSLDTLTAEIITKYPDCSAVASPSGSQVLFVIEKLYKRTFANAVGVILVDLAGEGKYRFLFFVGGGRTGMMQNDYGAEKHFLKEMEDIVTNFAQGGRSSK